MGQRNTRAAELAERYFLRAKAIDPNLDRNAILPQLDLEAIKRTWEAEREYARRAEARVAEAVRWVRRLPVEAFPGLPPAVAGVLRDRRCAVPQPFGEGTPRNVVRGDFFAGGEAGWAVLCSVDHVTALLVFRNDQDTNPHTLNTCEDVNSMQGDGADEYGYSREITAVGRDFIMGHYRAYGGPEPPPIDHHGIDDAFLGKASVTWYFHDGVWLRLTGAD
jgi:hypothetical protein